MMGAKDQKGVARGEEVNAFLGRGTAFEGKMTFEGLFRLDGKFNGEIFSGDSLIIGETGEVHAQIHVNTLIVNGRLEGSVTASSRVEICPPGRILGDIQTPTLVIEEGAVFDGSCHMEKREAKREEKVSVLKMKGDTEGDKETSEGEKESGS
jgi:cytoskeletal protein CcmA (bactofilin family)